MTTSVLVVDDQALVRAGFVMILEQADGIEVVGEAENGSDAVAAAERLGPDVVLMDIRMPEMDGIEATRQIIQRGATPIHVLILTTFDPDEYVYEALAAGASGFVLKEIDPEDLVSAIETVGAGEALLAPSITRRVIERFASNRPLSTEHRKSVERLTEREIEIVRGIARGMSNAELGDALFISTTTVKTHVSSVLSKLGLRDRTQAVVLAYESGLVQPGRYPAGHGEND